MAISSSLKKIISNVAENFDDVPFMDGVKKAAQTVAGGAVAGAGNVATKAGATKVGQEVVNKVSNASESYVGRKIKSAAHGTAEWYRRHSYNQSSFDKAREVYNEAVKEGKEAVKPKKKDFRTGKIINKDPDTFTGYRMSQLDTSTKVGLGVGAFAVSSAYNVGSVKTKTDEQLKYGEIYGDLSVGTINATFSPTHDKFVNSVVNYNNTGAVDEINGDLGAKYSGVDANLVFALHELRNGGAN